MARSLRHDAQHGHSRPRWTIGVEVSSECDRVAAALVATVGKGIELRAEIANVSISAIPRETTGLFGQLTSPAHSVGDRRSPTDGMESTDSDFAGRITSLAAQLAEVQARVVADLLAQSGIAPTQLLAVGVHDPGLWSHGRTVSGGYLGLCDAARLVELTNANVIDAFPARDVARGGQGGPITALAEWVLLKDPERSRLLLDLGRSVRMTYLPRDRGSHAASRLLSFDVGPGMRMPDQLTRRLTGGEHHYDPGGRLAVQGRRIAELQEHWLADPYFGRPLPRWQPRGVRPERFLIDGMRMAVNSGWSVRDLLCTATHFIAESVAVALRRTLPSDAPIDEIVLAGGGQHNGLLLREISSRLTKLPLTHMEQLGPSGEAIGPACIGLLAVLHVDGVPANHPAVTGTEAPRVLGRFTPGVPRSRKRPFGLVPVDRSWLRPARAAS